MRDTIDMAQEAQISDTTIEFYQQELKIFEKLVREDERKNEREACALVIENDCHDDMTRAEEAALIRARGQA